MDRAQYLLGKAPDNVIRVLQILSKSVDFRRSYIPTREHRQSAFDSESNIWLKPSFEMNNKKLVKRCDSERELLFTTSSTTFTQCAPKATEFGEITQNNGHYAVKGHSRSPILVPIEFIYDFLLVIGRPYVKRFALSYRTVVCLCPVCL